MLEKIGLPPKPSLKGNDWVLDASHCQGCSSAFTFFNRKHHCRRCGGIFCGNCTQQKITLRGQGDGPVRICEPCKKLEEAARFQSRYGHRMKANKATGSSKVNASSESVDSLLKELASREPETKGTELMKEVAELITPNHVRSMSTGELEKTGNDGLSQMTPEMLLLQAQEERKQWLVLKKEGKGEAALLAFKRGKELERQAENLKVSLRRSQKKLTSVTPRRETHEETISGGSRRKSDAAVSGSTQDGDEFPKKAKRTGLKECAEKKDDLMDALKEMGWNDADLQDAGSKQSKVKTVENELAELAAAVHQGDNSSGPKKTSSMEVLAHKRRALALKKEGHLAEAKEELKKAKLMERQLEEQEMFGGEDEESDEDLRALIRGMDNESMTPVHGDFDMDFSILGVVDHEEDESMDITDVDMDDPEMVAALRAMGWEEEAAETERTHQRGAAKPSHPNYSSHLHKSPKPIANPVAFLGNMDPSLDDVQATEDDMKDPSFLSALKAMGFEEEEPSKLIKSSIPTSKNKNMLQQEVLFLKKEALALKRAGKLQEAKEELHQAKQLEKQLKDFESRSNEDDVVAAFSVVQPSHGHEAEAVMLQEDDDKDPENLDVTEEDMGDPELFKALKSLGWQDDDIDSAAEPYEQSFAASHKSKTRSELQKELLGVKRAALKLRREGKAEQAEEELEKAHVLEQLLEESSKVSAANTAEKHASEKIVKVSKPSAEEPNMLAPLKADGIMNVKKSVEVFKPSTEGPNMQAPLNGAEVEMDESFNLPSLLMQQAKSPASEGVNSEDKGDGGQNGVGRDIKKQEPLGTSSSSSIPLTRPSGRRDSALEDEGGLHFTKAVDAAVGGEVRKGSNMSPREPEVTAEIIEHLDRGRQQLNSLRNQQDILASVNSTGSSPIKQEVWALKRQALALKRDGRHHEAKEKLREAKLLELNLASSEAQSESSGPEAQLPPNFTEMPNPDTSAASVRHPDISAVSSSSKQVCAPPSTAAQKLSASKDRKKLQQESLAHKRKALALRREGNTEDADKEFELAKAIEAQMEELEGATDGHSAVSRDDVGGIDDVFDPQLVAALKGLGWKETDILKPTPEVRQEAVGNRQERSQKQGMEVASAAGSSRPKQREQLEEQIKSEKVRALQLRRSGQQAEALSVLRGAKALEKKLLSLG